MIVPLGLALTLVSGVAPATARWAQGQERKILAEGVPLTAEALEFARTMEIQDPEGIRVLTVNPVPMPVPQPVVNLARKCGLPVMNPAGMTLGRGIYILPGHEWVIPHELVHVAQYQRLGGIEPFMRLYIRECLVHGYFEAPLEIEARERSGD
ncbi:hypothetical protein OJ996_19525 [Luteolibacter sp. GHJ8]|uniref:DUF4157 domain-containing protein n=1 Tax=Luteolibacter rhizosphaerae TaxID=2989719 RepID=A0ABT3G7F1_9BACT|nr:hypothetical protein [Luteolibacter rhizosphaerae]MCW1915786.1 hypothetical protein [Luteolibacter rhizosphaerae]